MSASSLVIKVGALAIPGVGAAIGYARMGKLWLSTINLYSANYL
jgi:hypothetical protein